MQLVPCGQCCVRVLCSWYRAEDLAELALRGRIHFLARGEGRAREETDVDWASVRVVCVRVCV